MLELPSLRKPKINLSDYDSEQDIENRILLSDFSSFELEILEEILYNPLRIPLKKLAKNLDCEEDKLLPTLEKLTKARLLALMEGTLVIDKEKRKHFEFQMARFDPDFKPDMEFVQGLLRKVPIHILPSWYSIPRTSNNIFESIIEKCLLTPSIFQRHLMEIHFGNPIAKEVMRDVFSAPHFKISSSDLIAKYNLQRREFEEILLLLEFNFVCCLTYEKEAEHWTEWVTPFHEWCEYLSFLKETETPPLDPILSVIPKRETDFAFIEDMSSLLLTKAHSFSQEHFSHVLKKLCLLKLADERLHISAAGEEWLAMSLDAKALYLYRSPLNRIIQSPLSPHLNNEKSLREAEKTIKRVLHGKWVFFDDFLKGALLYLNDAAQPILKRSGKYWKYALPSLGDEEKALIKATLFEWLFEMGMVAVGTCQGRDCFRVTSFGRFFFEE